jgi:hypothetical protein
MTVNQKVALWSAGQSSTLVSFVYCYHLVIILYLIITVMAMYNERMASLGLSHTHNLLFLNWRYFLINIHLGITFPPFKIFLHTMCKSSPPPKTLNLSFTLQNFYLQMHVSYWFGTAVGDLLFKGFTINSTSGSHNSMLISFIAVCMESICICSRQSAKIFFCRS